VHTQKGFQVSFNQTDKCEKCGDEIIWTVNSFGRKIPLNLKETLIYTEEGNAVLGRQSHLATCLKAEKCVE
jgi:hypothetical protein